MGSLAFQRRLAEIAEGRESLDIVVRVNAVLGPDYCTPVRDLVVGHAPDGREWVEIIVGWEEQEVHGVDPNWAESAE